MWVTDPLGAAEGDRVVIAVDCGIAITPDVVRAQMEGGIAFVHEGDLGPADAIMTVATDGAELYATEVDKIMLDRFSGVFEQIDAAEVFPYEAMFTKTFASSNPSRRTVASMMRVLA